MLRSLVVVLVSLWGLLLADDSLRSALDAVNRRQQELEGGYAPPGLRLLPPDIPGDGQPENIGYGYQKTMAGPSNAYQEERIPSRKVLEKLLMEYLEDGPNDYPKPRIFREREDDRKRSSFREREQADKQSLLHSVEEEVEREERQRAEEERKNEEYLALLNSVWEKYKASNPQVVDIDDLTPEDVDELLSSISDSGDAERDNYRNFRLPVNKRQYGNGYGSNYDYFNNNMMMGAWGGYRKRSKQRLESPDQPGSFLYSLKYVSPAANREAVETLKEEDGMDLPDERDEDILKLASLYNRHSNDGWYPVPFPRELPPEDIYIPNEEAYQKLTLSQLVPEASRKRMNSGYDLQSIPQMYESNRHVPPSLLYDNKRKRYPVTKRSSNYYASPPMLHHQGFSSDQFTEVRKKKDTTKSANSVTDPKVAKELNQIFGTNNDKAVKQDTSEGKAKSVKESVSFSKNQNATHVANLGGKLTQEEASKKHLLDGKDDKHEKKKFNHSVHNEEVLEQPVTMSRIQTPLEIKKKSIDWSQYFGIDRRRKKAAPSGTEKQYSDDSYPDDEWLMNEYYKTFAMATNPGKKRSSDSHFHPNMQALEKKQQTVIQPFDTRVFDTDIFARSAAREAGQKRNQNEESKLENVDSKLRNMEDFIVNEAVKYTGAHEGITDPREIQDVREKILNRLAEAYNLEKMRLALAEFKSSLEAQKMSKYNPANQVSEDDSDDKKKRVAVKKEKAEENITEEDKKKRDDKKRNSDDGGNQGLFLEGPVDIEPLSEGYMGNINSVDSCPVLENILRKCHGVGSMAGDHEQAFLPLCSLHQICYLCGPQVGAPTAGACDALFAEAAEDACGGAVGCQRVSRRLLAALRRSPPPRDDAACLSHSCVAQYFVSAPLTNPLLR